MINDRYEENLEKAKEILKDYDAGRSLQVRGDGWLIRLCVAFIEQDKLMKKSI